jgi:Putative transposase of IS4/5 family (DUF4096)
LLKSKQSIEQLIYIIFFCAVSYVLTSDCQWRMLPKDFPKWGTVYQYFLNWIFKASEIEPRCRGKISRTKHHIAVDTNGLPHAIFITTANITDRDGAFSMITVSKKIYQK